MINYKIGVEGMMCKNCEKHALEAVKKVLPSAKTTASHVDKEVSINVKNEIDINAVTQAIENCGYKVISFTMKETKNKLFGFIK